MDMSQSSAQPDTHETVTEPGAQRVAEVYAKALIAAAEKAGVTASALDELAAIDSEVLQKFPRLAGLFASGFISAEDKVKIVDRTFSERVSPLVLNFLRVLAEHERLELLRDIVRAARRTMTRCAGYCASRSPRPRRSPTSWRQKFNNIYVACLAASLCSSPRSNPS